MRKPSQSLLVLLALLALVACTASPKPSPTAPPSPLPTRLPPPTTPPATAAATPIPGPATPPAADPFALISQESLFASLSDLTAIQPYSGWRNSGTEGEKEALDYLEERLEQMEYLKGLGMERERQEYHIFMATELWETRLDLRIGGQEVEVPADGLRGDRDIIPLALHFDSDGRLNDAGRNPRVVEGQVLTLHDEDAIGDLNPEDVQGKVLLLDYALVDRVVLGQSDAVEIGTTLLEMEPAGVVLVTSYSNKQGESHGAFVGDVSALNLVEVDPFPPMLYVRLEDLASAGIAGWDDLSRIESARLTWDADVFAPGSSANLIARIPGTDPSRALILSAHIDSPNAPGALDDGAGSAVLLEVARVLNEAQAQPPTDVYLVWFGSEELGLYGSSYFVATHQDLLDRTIADLQVDCMSRPLDGIEAWLTLETWPYSHLGDDRLPWPDYLTELAGRQGIETRPEESYSIASDNSTFAPYNVPNVNLIYMNGREMEEAGGVHYAGHLHDPYDTVDLVREVADVFEQMARVALSAALYTGQDNPDLQVVPPPEKRAVFVGSHTESIHMTPTWFTELGMAWGMEGLDVDMAPYGRAVTTADLEGASVVVALPVMDYPSPDGDPNLYDEAWSEAEVALLQDYVNGGGLLVLTNSAHRLKYATRLLDANEDWSDANLLAERFGVTYREGTLSSEQARKEVDSPLLEGASIVGMLEGNGIPFTMANGQVLATAGGEPAIGLVEYGSAGGQVLVLADVGMLGASSSVNLRFWRALARYARGR